MIRWLLFLFKKKNSIQPGKRRSYRLDAPDRLLEKLRALDRGNGAFARNAYYMREFGVSERTIRRWLSVLATRGDIRVSGSGKGRRIHVSDSSEKLIKPQTSYYKKKEPVRSSRTDCPSNGRVMSGQCPDNVRDKYRSNDRTILKSKYVDAQKNNRDKLKAWRREQVDSLSDEDIRRMLG